VLSPSGGEDGDLPSKNISSMKRTVLMVIKGLAAVAAVVFWLCPLRTGTQILLFVASIAVLLLCHVLLTELDETYVAKGPTGYWPKPSEWNTPAKNGDPVPNRAGAEPKH